MISISIWDRDPVDEMDSIGWLLLTKGAVRIREGKKWSLLRIHPSRRGGGEDAAATVFYAQCRQTKNCRRCARVYKELPTSARIGMRRVGICRHCASKDHILSG